MHASIVSPLPVREHVSEVSSQLILGHNDISPIPQTTFSFLSMNTYIPDDAVYSEYKFMLATQGPLAFLSKHLASTMLKADLCKLLLDLRYPVALLQKHDSLPARHYAELLLSLISLDARRHLLSHLPGNFPVPSHFRYTIEHFLHDISHASKILLITGAGILTSLGIPDFRSFKGLYSQLAHLNLQDPQQAFDIATFRHNPAIFYSIAHLVLPPGNKFAVFHSFTKLLSEKKKLLRNYTQNIDNLEMHVGIPPAEIVQCHGLFGMATCQTCHSRFLGSKIVGHINAKLVPRCSRCYQTIKINDEVPVSYGVLKPDITFFGEDLPRRYHSRVNRDSKNCDMVIVAGTSLKVEPVLTIIEHIPLHVPRILMNRDDITTRRFDLKLFGDCDTIVSYCTLRLSPDWKINHPMVVEKEYTIEPSVLVENGFDIK